MKEYDVVFLHPPKSFKDIRQKLYERFSRKRTAQFCYVPMGVFSLAASLDRAGYNVKIVDLGLEQEVNAFFSLRRYIRSLNAKVFAIDLQWWVHIASALKLAEICKRHHPNGLVLLGGMTATWFHEEILKGYPSVDVVVRGEADFSMPQLVDAYLRHREIGEVEGITYRQGERIRQNSMGKIPSSLDVMETVRFELLDKYEEYFQSDVNSCDRGSAVRHFWIPIVRGCPYDCAHCGGGRHAYWLLTGRENTIERSPKKVALDVETLKEKGVNSVHFSHDPEIRGRKYYLKIFEEVKNRNIDMSAYIEIFRLPSREFIKKLAETFHNPVVAISPETPSEEVRRLIGREFTNFDFFKSLRNLKKEGIHTEVYFTTGLPREPTWLEWFESYKKFVEKIAHSGGLVVPPFAYTIDPNCLLAVDNERYGIKLLIKNLEDYKSICYSTNRLNWIGHETENMSKQEIATLVHIASTYTKSYFADYLTK